ncbi:enhanced intracellular survival protein Eis [Nocardioides sp.]|uniref:GNAT family N-acetyltransferase n=1 Tax=Nocardioides sp. TaxID=35761 RepID=UPI0035135236
MFDGGRLVAKMVALDLVSWLGGREVPTCGIAGVAIAAEHRGAGLLGRLFPLIREHAAAQGQPVSTLFPTAPGIYRGQGYEIVGSYDTVELATADLARLRAPREVTLHRAGPEHVEQARAVYTAWARAQHGPLTRTGPLYDDETPAQYLADTEITVARREDEPIGMLAWDRSGGYQGAGVLEVRDLMATAPGGYEALWAMVGTFASVARRVRVHTSGPDPARLVLPADTWDVVARHPYMLAVTDLVGAVAALDPRLPVSGGRAEPVPLRVGEHGFRLHLTARDCADPSVATPLPGTDAALAAGPRLHPRGLALLLGGAQQCANLRLLGLLDGPADHDAVLDAAFTGRPVHIRDYF